MKKNWSKTLFIASDVILAVYLLFAFTTVSKKSSATTVCSKVDIRIADEMTNGFLDAATVKHNLQKAGCYPVINKPLTDVNTRSIEEALMLRTPFVKTAECYKTEGGNVYITVTQRMPVIRFKAENGDDYYVDDNDRVMKSSSYTSDLIIATGNINRQYATRYLSPLGKVIMGNELWKNIIEQVSVLAPEPEIGAADLPIEVQPCAETDKEAVRPLGEVVAGAEQRCIAKALARCGGNRSHTAALLGISRKNLWEKMRRHGIGGTG